VIINPRTKYIKQALAQSSIQTTMDAVANSLKSALEPLAKEIRTGLSQLNESQKRTPLSSHPPAKLRRVLPAKRLFSELVSATNTSPAISLVAKRTTNINNNNINNNIAVPSLAEHNNINITNNITSRQPIAIYGTDNDSPNLPTVQNRFVPKMWLHLANIAPGTSCEQVVESVKRRLATTDVIAFSLMGKNFDTTLARPMSFKVRIPAHLRETALSSSVWPSNLRVREFILRDNRPASSHPLACLTPMNAHETPLQSINAVPIDNIPKPAEQTINEKPNSSSPSNVQPIVHNMEHSPIPADRTAQNNDVHHEHSS